MASEKFLQGSENEVIGSYNRVFFNNQGFEDEKTLEEGKEEIFLYNYFNHKLRCGEAFNDKEKKVFLYITNKLHTKYAEIFSFKDVKSISHALSTNYPERKYNQLVISHTLKEKKYSLISFISSFISAYDSIVFYKEGIIMTVADPFVQKMTIVKRKQIYILDTILKKAEQIYHDCFKYYHSFFDGDNKDKLKAYTQIEMLVDEYKNHKLINETINLSNNLSYISLRTYTGVSLGEVGASPEIVGSRDNFLTQEDDSEVNEEDETINKSEKPQLNQEDLEKEIDDDDDIEPI